AAHRSGFVRVEAYPMISPVPGINQLGYWDIPLDYFDDNDTVVWTAEGLRTAGDEPLPGAINGNLRESVSCKVHVQFVHAEDSVTQVLATRSSQSFYLYDDELPPLRDVWLPITGRCNLECVMCGRTRRDELPLMKVFFRNADVSDDIVDAGKAQA